MNPIDIQAARAHKLAATAPSWLKIRSRSTGYVIGYGVPSQSQPDLYHKANATTCDCKAWEYRHTCVHQRAVELLVRTEGLRAEGTGLVMDAPDRPAIEMSASATIDGLTQMVRDREASDIFNRL